jgi:hypothetical protein
MFNKEEDRLREYKQMVDHLPVSLESLDDAIMAGFNKAKLEEKSKPRRRGAKWLYGFVAAAVLLIGFFTSVRLSPAFAGYITTIPGMEKIVDLIRFDKGQMAAIENDYYQEIGASDEKNGLKVTIDGVIADENGIVLFYSLESNEKQKRLQIDEAKLEYQDGGKFPPGVFSYGSSHFSDKGETSFNGVLDNYFQQPLTSNKLVLNLKISGNTQEEYSIPFTLQKNVAEKKTYELNKTIEIEGQKLTFVKATVYPLRVAIHVKKDPNNTKKILGYEDLRLVDENGEVWNKISNGQTGTTISENEEIIYLQSNYFRQPKELYLAVNKIQAIDKSEEFVVVDLVKEQILQQPKGNLLRGITVKGNYIDFQMAIPNDFPAFIFHYIYDQNGDLVSFESFSKSWREDKTVVNFGVNIPNLQKIQGPLSLQLNAYPSWIEGEAKIRLK